MHNTSSFALVCACVCTCVRFGCLLPATFISLGQKEAWPLFITPSVLLTCEMNHFQSCAKQHRDYWRVLIWELYCSNGFHLCTHLIIKYYYFIYFYIFLLLLAVVSDNRHHLIQYERYSRSTTSLIHIKLLPTVYIYFFNYSCVPSVYNLKPFHYTGCLPSEDRKTSYLFCVSLLYCTLINMLKWI